ncbi:hypothetical protein BA195_11505 [Tenacibaculum soleae]|uniref:Uncharacterized protein n=1 Tax=Tenacibaculum soleae TaxID=447689 RepID=A0A1B9XXF9_9FLAO|nr:hypothetical protein [Tenacibaculum soleae]OCK42243.1 hypothetical protein BA195_11505 [Tenacibaculum soleae]
MKINSNNFKEQEESIYSSQIKQQLISLIKTKYEGLEDVLYESILKDFSLLKDENGVFHIIIPTIGKLKTK